MTTILLGYAKPDFDLAERLREELLRRVGDLPLRVQTVELAELSRELRLYRSERVITTLLVSLQELATEEETELLGLFDLEAVSETPLEIVPVLTKEAPESLLQPFKPWPEPWRWLESSRGLRGVEPRAQGREIRAVARRVFELAARSPELEGLERGDRSPGSYGGAVPDPDDRPKGPEGIDFEISVRGLGREETAVGEDAENPPDVAWSAYPLLRCVSQVVAETPFPLVLGLAPQQQEGVTGERLELPDPELGPYQLDVDLSADGFRLEGHGIHLRRSLVVSTATPYPSVTVSVVAERDRDLVSQRSIMAMYSVRGKPFGHASRTVTVIASAAEAAPSAAVEEPTAGGIDEAVLAGERAPDLTLRITKGNRRAPGSLVWTLVSPHPVPLDPQDPEDRRSDLGGEAETFASELLQAAGSRTGKPLYDHLRGAGRRDIAGKIPGWVVQTLRDVTARCGERRPRVLVASDEPYVPWELAVLEPPVAAADGSPFLGAQVVLGRWIPGAHNRPPASPTRLEVEVGETALVGCSLYPEVHGFRRLEAAEEEVEALREITTPYHAVEGLHAEVSACLDGNPPADVLHFALHGTFDHPVHGSGLVLVSEVPEKPGSYHIEMLTREQVLARDLRRHPFVFLNACQVGAGDEVLGDYGGLVEGFLYAGASAVIAPLWKIDDAVAKEVALDFYREVFGGELPAEVLRRERARFRGEEGQSGTCLAYQFYGHPELRMHKRRGD